MCPRRGRDQMPEPIFDGNHCKKSVDTQLGMMGSLNVGLY